MLRPLPPFRAEPSKKPAASKQGVRKGASESISIKAGRQSIRTARDTSVSPLKVLGRATPNGNG